MSMSLRFHTVSDLDISDIEENQLRLEILYYGELLDPSVLDDRDEFEAQQVINWRPREKSNTFYVEGMFQSLHYLLTLEVEYGKGVFPLNFLTGRRREIGEIGWGKATFYNSLEVKQITEALSELDLSEIKERYNAEFYNANTISPKGYNWSDSDKESLTSKLKELIDFMAECASQKLGIYRVIV